MFLSSKTTEKIKIQDQIILLKKKKKSHETLASWDFKLQVGNLNFGQTSNG